MVLNDPEFQQWARQNNLYVEDTNRILATIRRQPATEVAKRINTQATDTWDQLINENIRKK